MKKAELLGAMRRVRADLDALVGSLDEAQITAPSLDGGWSVKDTLAHISLWERLCTSWLQEVARGRTPARPEVRDVDATNAGEYERARALSPAEVAAESRLSHEAMIASVEALSEADLADDKRFGWATWQMIDGNSSEHYREHENAIRAMLAKA